eukprot:EC691645.1.p1 GENE.EC691645.1~~EC691645.1.p1  ORF type:complete len:215 (+),score=34.50 EC691645.1:17-661(+)
MSFAELPEELLLDICGRLCVGDRLALRLTCQRLRHVALLCIDSLSVAPPPPPPPPPPPQLQLQHGRPCEGVEEEHHDPHGGAVAGSLGSLLAPLQALQGLSLRDLPLRLVEPVMAQIAASCCWGNLLEFKCRRSELTLAGLETLLGGCGGSLRKLMLYGSCVEGRGLRIITELCPHLEVLVLDGNFLSLELGAARGKHLQQDGPGDSAAENGAF